MKNILYLILCAFVTLNVVADGLTSSQEQLIQIVPSRDSFPKVPDEAKLSYSKLHPMGERIDNPLLTDTDRRIVMVDCYDFDWDSANGTATVDESSRFMYGKLARLNSQKVVQDLYMQYDIPIDVDENSRKVKLHTGKLLATFILDSTTHYCVYAMPEMWLTTQTDDCDDIVGRLHHDGAIEFNDGFAFLIEKKILRDSVWETSSWELSPIFRNLHLFVPNGKHTYTSKIDSVMRPPFPGGPVGGGLSPRPIKPKPDNVKPKPVTPRAFDPKHTLGNAGDAITDSDLILLSSVPDPEFKIHLFDDSIQHSVPVYIYQADDSTIYVYNLYGSNLNWNRMNINPDGTMSFPLQEVSENSDYGLYNYSCRDKNLVGGNQGTYDANAISWDDTYLDCCYVITTEDSNAIRLRNNGSYMLTTVYMNNLLTYTKPHNPKFSQPALTDSTVTFSAVGLSSGEVMLLLYDPVQDIYSPAPNPYTVPRTDTAYNVSLVAYTRVRNGVNRYSYSGDVYFEYEVPALAQAEQGDVNNDGTVDITDVTILINNVLGTTGSNDKLSSSQVNVNSIDIEDITTLIYRVLYGHFPLEEDR